MVTVAIFRKKKYFGYGNILDNFVFQHYRAKIKVKVAVRRNLFHCSGRLIFKLILIYNFTKMLSMNIFWIGSCFRVL